MEGRILELLCEPRRDCNSPPPRFEVVGEAFEGSGVPGIRSEGSDFLRVGSVAEDTRGGGTREGDDGAVSIGGCIAGAAASAGTSDSPNPGGSTGSGGSGGSGNGTPFVATVAALANVPETATSGAMGGAGGLMPKDKGSRSTAW